MKLFLEIVIIFLGSVNLLLTRLALFRLHQPTTIFLWAMKVFVSAISPLLFITGVLLTVFGFLLNSLPTIILGSSSALLYLLHIIKISSAPESSTNLEQAFEYEKKLSIPAERKSRFLSKRYVFRLPVSPDPIFKQNISFHTIPGTNRELLCDMWQPSENVKRSGLAFIYLHGSAWAVLDKDFGTRPFFRHLANQGHVIMDIAYRLFPETDLMGMVHDAKHAIAWMKANAASYGVNPKRIIIGGGSAGGHIALLAAYTANNKQLMPPDLESVDLSIQGVISLYGQSDLAATYYHTAQHIATHSALSAKKKGESGGMPLWLQKSMGINFHRLGFDKNVEPGMLDPILGGNPKEKPEAYALFSPIVYVEKDSPPTLILHGDHDILAPLTAMRQLYSSLKKFDVPVAMHVIPQTDHAFDLILPKISPSAQNAIYDVERFLELMSRDKITNFHKGELLK